MAISPVPLPAANVPVHDPQTGLMTLPWRKFYEYQTYLAEQQAAQTQAAAQQAAAAQTQANAASAQASAAQQGSGGGGGTPQPQNMGASGSTTVSSTTWAAGAQVTFSSAIAASSVSVQGSGPTAATGRTSTSTVSGQARIVRTVGGTDTVIAGPVNYTSRYDGDSHAVEMDFAGFTDPSGADPTTGAISYRIDLQGTDGAQVQSTVAITRNP